MIEANIYKALGDPVRLEIVTRLTQKPSHTIGELSKDLGVSRQGARKQLQVLISADLIQLIPEGRQTQVLLKTAQLKMAREFISRLEQQWDQRLMALKNFVEDTST